LINLIKNELKKIFSKKAIYIVLIITIGFCILSNIMQKRARETVYSYMNYNYEPEEDIVIYEDNLEIAKENGDTEGIIILETKIEKIKTKEEMKEILETLTKKELTEEENKYLQIILNYSNDVRKKLDAEEIIEYKEILNGKGEVDMTNFERLLIELIDEKREKYEAGQKNSIKKVIQNMLKMKMTDKNIMDATQVNSKELQKIKQELKAC